MYRNVPPLRALRAFEAAARHLNFTAAAEELHVTQAAVSQQIKHLESLLDVLLFRRLNRRLILTDEAHVFLPEVRESLEQLSAATARIAHRQQFRALNLSVMPSFATRWLIPRLSRFQRRQPDIQVRISAFDWRVNFDMQDLDIAIRHGRDEWPGLHVQRLLGEEIFPVCSPQLAKTLNKPDNLAQLTLLHDDYSREDWRSWLETASADSVDPGRGLSFSHTGLMLEAAERGLGIALGRTPLVTEALDSGRLVKPFDIALTGNLAYYVVCPPSVAEYPHVKAFREWLLEEAKTF